MTCSLPCKLTLCLQTWTMSDRNMVGCDSCDSWAHDRCGLRAAAAVMACSAQHLPPLLSGV